MAPAIVVERALHQRSGSARLRRPRRVRRRPRFRAPCRGARRSGLSARALATGEPTRSIGPGTPPGIRRRRPKCARRACRRSSFPSTSHVSIVDARRQRRRDDDDDRGRVRQPADDRGGFLLNNELTDFSFVPTEDGNAGREPRRGAASGRARRWRRRSSSIARGRVFMIVGSPGGHGDHQLRREDASRRARLAARSAGRDRAPELRQPQRADRAGEGHGGDDACTGARALGHVTRVMRRRAACRRSCAPRQAGSAAPIRGAKARCAAIDAKPG